LPSLVLGDEAAYDRRKVVAPGQKESVQTHIRPSFMRKVLDFINKRHES
jgi:hypothetical protein